MSKKLCGIIPAITSPCDENDRFLEEPFGALINSLYAAGVHGLYVCGATGDAYNVRIEERKKALAIAVKLSARHRGLVIAHVGTLNSRDSMELAAHAADTGADAVACMPPANRSHDELYAYYRDVARAAKIPTLIYHIPHLTGHNLPASFFCKLFDLPHVAGIKFTDYDLFLMKRLLLDRPDIVVFNGSDELLALGLLYGACGGIGMTYNIFPKYFVNLYQAVLDGKIARAIEMQNRFCAFLNCAMGYGIRPVLDLIMRERGFGPFSCRRPRTVLSEAASREYHRKADPLAAAMEAAMGRK